MKHATNIYIFLTYSKLSIQFKKKWNIRNGISFIISVTIVCNNNNFGWNFKINILKYNILKNLILKWKKKCKMRKDE